MGRGTVELGGEVGNVAYDSDLDRMAVAVAGAGELAIIDPPRCRSPRGSH